MRIAAGVVAPGLDCGKAPAATDPKAHTLLEPLDDEGAYDYRVP